MIIAAKNRKLFVNFDFITAFYIKKSIDNSFGLVACDGKQEYWLDYFFSDKDIYPVICNIVSAAHEGATIYLI